MIHTPSFEQQAILNAIEAGHNIKVSAVAGSGKTTTMLMICKAFAESKNVLALTYNARLKDEMRIKIDKLGLSNVEAHSYHAFFVRYYGAKCCTDNGILDTLERNDKPKTSFIFNCVIIDEVQDMTPLYYKAVKKLINDMTNKIWNLQELTENTFDDLEYESSTVISQIVVPTISCNDDDFDFTSTASIIPVVEVKSVQVFEQEPESIKVQLCLFGDPSQNIYAFKEADERFLTLAKDIWKDFPRIMSSWVSLDLSQSFRVTKPIAEFVNQACLGYDKIKSTKRGSRVKYLICNSFGLKPTNLILKLLKNYEPSDFFIIAPSIRSDSSPIKKMENNLVAAGYPCFASTNDEEILNQDIISGKIVFSSIHQTKGLERKVVMIFNFDASYFEFFCRDEEPSICPNALYVGSTRSMEELILIHDRKQYSLPFLDMDFVYNECLITVDNYEPKSNSKPKKSEFSVIDLTRHLTLDSVNELLHGVETQTPDNIAIEVFDLGSPIKIPTIVAGTHGDESVADVNGICLPAIYEFKTQPQVSIIDFIKYEKRRLPEYFLTQIEQCLHKFSEGGCPTITDFLFLSF
jgi:superfamily I DNA/RNA helicase